MGLLDNANWNDPVLAMAAGLLGSQTLGQGLSRGLLGGMQAEQQAQQNQMRKMLFQSQMEENRAQAEQRRALAAKAQRDAEDAAKFEGWTAKAMNPGAEIPDGFKMLGPGSNLQNFQRQPGAFPPELLALAARTGKLDELRKISESNNWGRQKVGRVIDVQGPDGRPMQQQIDEFGQPVGAPMPKPYERRLEDMGGTKQPYDPYTGGLTGTALPKTMTPGETASNAVAWANNRVAQGNLGVAQRGLTLREQELNQGKWQYDPARGGLVNINTGEFKPATQNGQPIGAKESPITESQANANIYASRALESNRILSEIGSGYQPAKINAQQALAGTPVVGGALGWAGNKALTDNEQRVVQAQRDFINAILRKESGAVIAQSEFDNARKQYFPQPGDSDAVIAQKARNREIALQGLVTAAGPAMGRNQPLPDAGGWKYLGKE